MAATCQLCIWDSTVILGVSGDLDVEGAPALNLAVPDGVRQVVMDARRLSFVDSSGLKAFVTLHRQVPVRILTAEDSGLRRLLNLTGIDTVIDVYGSVDEALAG